MGKETKHWIFRVKWQLPLSFGGICVAKEAVRQAGLSMWLVTHCCLWKAARAPLDHTGWGPAGHSQQAKQRPWKTMDKTSFQRASPRLQGWVTKELTPFPGQGPFRKDLTSKDLWLLFVFQWEMFFHWSFLFLLHYDILDVMEAKKFIFYLLLLDWGDWAWTWLWTLHIM